jgi:hypothetical protein
MTINDYELVALRRDIDAHNLRVGDVGMVLDCYADGAGYEAEFGDAQGNTIAVISILATDVERLTDRQILHVRQLIEA